MFHILFLQTFNFFQRNPTIFIESTIHAREWVTVATATYLLNELLTSNDPEIIEMSNNYDWVFVPVVNVDGYVYSHTKVGHEKFDFFIHQIALFVFFEFRIVCGGRHEDHNRIHALELMQIETLTLAMQASMICKKKYDLLFIEEYI